MVFFKLRGFGVIYFYFMSIGNFIILVFMYMWVGLKFKKSGGYFVFICGFLVRVFVFLFFVVFMLIEG